MSERANDERQVGRQVRSPQSREQSSHKIAARTKAQVRADVAFYASANKNANAEAEAEADRWRRKRVEVEEAEMAGRSEEKMRQTIRAGAGKSRAPGCAQTRQG